MFFKFHNILLNDLINLKIFALKVFLSILYNIAINRGRKISGSEADGNFANLGERMQRSEPVNCC